MEDHSQTPERRSSIRFNASYPVIYTRFDREGRPCDEKPSRSLNVSLGGMRLQTDFPVSPKEVLNIAMALKGTELSFEGKVIYVMDSQDRNFEFGISIQKISSRDRMALARFESQIKDIVSDPEHNDVIIRMEQILCPNCAEPIGSTARIRSIIAYCKEILGQCRCGVKYTIKLSFSNEAVLSLSNRPLELIC